MTLKFVVCTARIFFSIIFPFDTLMKRKKNADKFDNSLPEIEQWMPTGSLSIPDNSVNFLKKEVQPMSNSLATGVDDISVKC